MAVENRVEQGRAMYDLGLRLGALGPVAVGSAGGSLAGALARMAGGGIVLAGGDARFHDGSCAACGIWLAGYYSLSAALFLRQEGERVTVTVTDREGNQFAPPGAENTAPCTGEWSVLRGAELGWAARRAAGCRCSMAVAAEGPPGLRLMLERMGCDVLCSPGPGVPRLKSDGEGLCLRVEWRGAVTAPPGADALDAAARWLGEGRAIPAFLPTEM